MFLGCSPVGRRQRTGTGVWKEQRPSFERGWPASRGSRALQYGAGDDRGAQYGFEPFAATQ